VTGGSASFAMDCKADPFRYSVFQSSQNVTLRLLCADDFPAAAVLQATRRVQESSGAGKGEAGLRKRNQAQSVRKAKKAPIESSRES
jgi:hypothetical protein